MERIFHTLIQSDTVEILSDTEKHEKSTQKIVLLPKSMII